MLIKIHFLVLVCRTRAWKVSPLFVYSLYTEYILTSSLVPYPEEGTCIPVSQECSDPKLSKKYCDLRRTKDSNNLMYQVMKGNGHCNQGGYEALGMYFSEGDKYSMCIDMITSWKSANTKDEIGDGSCQEYFGNIGLRTINEWICSKGPLHWNPLLLGV